MVPLSTRKATDGSGPFTDRGIAMFPAQAILLGILTRSRSGRSPPLNGFVARVVHSLRSRLQRPEGIQAFYA
jgi:hypothetical protein